MWKQKKLEITGGIGPSFFFGDVGGFSKTKNILGLRDLSFLQTRFDVNMSFKYRITQDVNVRLSLIGFTFGEFAYVIECSALELIEVFFANGFQNLLNLR